MSRYTPIDNLALIGNYKIVERRKGLEWLYVSVRKRGRLAQVGERYPRTVEAAGSSPAPSIYYYEYLKRAISSVGERSPHKGEVGGSNPPSPIVYREKKKVIYWYYLFTI